MIMGSSCLGLVFLILMVGNNCKAIEQFSKWGLYLTNNSGPSRYGVSPYGNVTDYTHSGVSARGGIGARIGRSLESYRNSLLQNGTGNTDSFGTNRRLRRSLTVRKTDLQFNEQIVSNSKGIQNGFADLNEENGELDTEGTLCRTRNGRFLPPSLFGIDTCTDCYFFEMHKNRRLKKPWLMIKRNYEMNGMNYTVSVLVNSSDALILADTNSDVTFHTIDNVRVRNNWKKCCEASRRCCGLIGRPTEDVGQNYCPRTWDGWQCWPDASPNTENFEVCPTYSYIHTIPSCQKKATKYCTANGSWFTKHRHEWTDYSSCGELDNIRLRLTFHVAALSLSILALIPALAIFYSYRQLHVYRITLHKHLFISLLFEAICSLSFRLLQLFGLNIIEQSPIWCIGLCLVRKYAKQTNYMWYLCEGFYLHNLLASAFAENNSILIFYVIGWGLPIIPMGIYGTLRALWYKNSHCWTIPVDGLEYLIQLPPLFAMLINFIFIINIIRILLMKVRASHECNEPSQFRMAVRACLMVIPLFGLQYIVTLYRPTGQACYWIDVYHIMNSVIDGSTGVLVALIFCYTNNEVRSLLKRSWRKTFSDHDGIAGHSGKSRQSTAFASVHTTLMDENHISKMDPPPKPSPTQSINSEGTQNHSSKPNLLTELNPIASIDTKEHQDSKQKDLDKIQELNFQFPSAVNETEQLEDIT